jgi:hypothetical protein
MSRISIFRKKNFFLNSRYGRFGNNIQQAGLASMFANKYQVNVYVKNLQKIKPYNIINSKFSSFFRLGKNSSRFFFFGSKKFNNFNPDDPLVKEDFDYYHENFYDSIRTFVKPNIEFLKEIYIDPNILVVHIRGFTKENPNGNHPDYIQNPIIYYKEILSNFDKVLVVTDDRQTSIINSLKKDFNVKVQSTSIENDFNTLISAKNLATSGVGTFSIAAAIISDRLENLFFSNFYLDRHLNPKMIHGGVSKFEFKIMNYLKFGDWDVNKDSLETTIHNHKEIVVPDLFKKTFSNTY